MWAFWCLAAFSYPSQKYSTHSTWISKIPLAADSWVVRGLEAQLGVRAKATLACNSALSFPHQLNVWVCHNLVKIIRILFCLDFNRECRQPLQTSYNVGLKRNNVPEEKKLILFPTWQEYVLWYYCAELSQPWFILQDWKLAHKFKWNLPTK